MNLSQSTISVMLAIVALVLSPMLSIAANLLSPSVRSWWAYRSAERASAYIRRLEAKLSFVSKLWSDPAALQLFFYQRVLFLVGIAVTAAWATLIFVTFEIISEASYAGRKDFTIFGFDRGAFFGALSLIALPIAGGFLMWLHFLAQSTRRTLLNVRDFASFEANTEASIAAHRRRVP